MPELPPLDAPIPRCKSCGLLPAVLIEAWLGEKDAKVARLEKLISDMWNAHRIMDECNCLVCGALESFESARAVLLKGKRS